MKMKILLLFSLFFLLFSLSSVPTYALTVIGTSTIAGMYPPQSHICKDGVGNLHVVYGYNDTDNRYANSSNGGISWTVNSSFYGSTATVSTTKELPGISCNGNNITVVYEDVTADDLLIAISTNNGATWTWKNPVTSSVDGVFNGAGVQRIGQKIYAVYIDASANSIIMFLNSSDGGSTWSSAVAIATPGGAYNYNYPSIIVSGNGDANDKIFIAFRNSSNGDIYFINSTNAGVTWGAIKKILDGGGAKYSPSITLINSNLYAVATDNTNGDVYFANSTDYGATWTTDYRLDLIGAGAYDCERAIVTTDNNGYPRVFWWQNNVNVNYDIVYRSHNGTAWNDSVTPLTNNNKYNQFVNVPKQYANDNKIYYIWQNGTTTYKILFDYINLTIADSTPPTYNNILSNVTNNTAVNTGTPISISAQWSDNVAVSMYVNSSKVNNSGSWANGTWQSFTSGNWSNFTIIFPSEQKSNITVKIYANDTSNNQNVTGTWFWYNVSVPPDSQSPTYSLNSTNSTLAGTPVKHNLNWSDNSGLSGYIFQFCNGTWNGTNCLGGSTTESIGSFVDIGDSTSNPLIPNVRGICIDGSNKLHAIWGSSTTSLVYANSSDYGATWSYNNNFYGGSSTAGSTKYRPVINCDGNNITVAYKDTTTTDVEVGVSTNNGASWTWDNPVTGAINEQDISIKGQRVYLTYHTSNKSLNFTYSTDQGVSWSAEKTIMLLHPDAPGQEISMAVDGNGSATDRIYVLGGDTFYYDVYFVNSTDGGSTWSARTTIATGTFSRPSIIFNGQNLYVIVNGGSTPYGVYFMNSTDYGATWTSPYRIDTLVGAETSLNPAIALNNNGYPIAFWGQTNDSAGYDYNIYYRSYNGTAWENVKNLTYDNLDWRDPTATDSKNGRIFLLARRNQASSYDIMFDYINFSSGTNNWINNTWTSMTGSGNWSNVTKIVNSTVGSAIAWCVYANDTSNNWNGTSCSNPFTYVTTSAGGGTINNVSIGQSFSWTNSLQSIVRRIVSTTQSITFTEYIQNIYKGFISKTLSMPFSFSTFKQVLGATINDVSKSLSITFSSVTTRFYKAFITSTGSLAFSSSLTDIYRGIISKTGSFSFSTFTSNIYKAFITKSLSITWARTMQSIYKGIISRTQSFSYTGSIQPFAKRIVSKTLSITYTSSLQNIYKGIISKTQGIAFSFSISAQTVGVNLININQAINFISSPQNIMKAFISRTQSFSLTSSLQSIVRRIVSTTQSITFTEYIQNIYKGFISKTLSMPFSFSTFKQVLGATINDVSKSLSITFSSVTTRFYKAFITSTGSLAFSSSLTDIYRGFITRTQSFTVSIGKIATVIRVVPKSVSIAFNSAVITKVKYIISKTLSMTFNFGLNQVPAEEVPSTTGSLIYRPERILELLKGKNILLVLWNGLFDQIFPIAMNLWIMNWMYLRWSPFLVILAILEIILYYSELTKGRKWWLKILGYGMLIPSIALFLSMLIPAEKMSVTTNVGFVENMLTGSIKWDTLLYDIGKSLVEPVVPQVADLGMFNWLYSRVTIFMFFFTIITLTLHFSGKLKGKVPLWIRGLVFMILNPLVSLFLALLIYL